VRKRFPYKTGVVNTTTHPILMKGQVVEVLSESSDYYKVRVYLTAKVETLKKEDVVVN